MTNKQDSDLTLNNNTIPVAVTIGDIFKIRHTMQQITTSYCSQIQRWVCEQYQGNV